MEELAIGINSLAIPLGSGEDAEGGFIPDISIHAAARMIDGVGGDVAVDGVEGPDGLDEDDEDDEEEDTGCPDIRLHQNYSNINMSR
jgi:hypothetical protein